MQSCNHSLSSQCGRKPLVVAEDLMVRSDTDVLRVTPGMNRSMSAPSGVDDDSLAEVVRLQR